MKFIIFSFCILLALPSLGQVSIQLSGKEQGYAPQHFYISDVVDSRTNKGSLGKIREGDVTIEGGLINGLQEYINAMQGAQGDKTPVTMHINKLDLTEKNLGSKRQFDLNIAIAYYIGSSKLLEYKGGSFAQARDNPQPYIEKLVRQNIIGNLKQFDAWMAKNKHTISAEPTVDVNVYFSNLSDKKEQIAYSKKRKLFITDFEAEPDMESVGAAATLSGVGMTYQVSTLRNKTDVDVTVSVYFDKSRSWMKDNGKNVTTLQHEQLHFDITAIKACELKHKIEEAKFSPDNYKAQLKQLLDNAQKEGAEMQNTYDSETEHGTIIDEQEKWNTKVAELLKKQDCF